MKTFSLKSQSEVPVARTSAHLFWEGTALGVSSLLLQPLSAVGAVGGGKQMVSSCTLLCRFWHGFCLFFIISTLNVWIEENSEKKLEKSRKTTQGDKDLSLKVFFILKTFYYLFEIPIQCILITFTSDSSPNSSQVCPHLSIPWLCILKKRNNP